MSIPLWESKKTPTASKIRAHDGMGLKPKDRTGVQILHVPDPTYVHVYMQQLVKTGHKQELD